MLGLTLAFQKFKKSNLWNNPAWYPHLCLQKKRRIAYLDEKINEGTNHIDETSDTTHYEHCDKANQVWLEEERGAVGEGTPGEWWNEEKEECDTHWLIAYNRTQLACGIIANVIDQFDRHHYSDNLNHEIEKWLLF